MCYIAIYVDTGNDRVVSCFETMNRMSEIYEIVNDFSNAEIILRKTGKLTLLFSNITPCDIYIL